LALGGVRPWTGTQYLFPRTAEHSYGGRVAIDTFTVFQNHDRVIRTIENCPEHAVRSGNSHFSAASVVIISHRVSPVMSDIATIPARAPGAASNDLPQPISVFLQPFSLKCRQPPTLHIGKLARTFSPKVPFSTNWPSACHYACVSDLDKFLMSLPRILRLALCRMR